MVFLAMLPLAGKAQQYNWSIWAGSAGGAGYLDGPAAAAHFSAPTGAAVDAAGNLYVADSGNQVIRKISTDGVVSTVAGLVGASGTADGIGAAARFHTPEAVAVDGSGNVYVADTGNHTIRKITPDGTVTTLAGSAGVSGSADGTGSAARFFVPFGLAVDAAGTLYVADTENNTIRKITSAGVVTTLAGQASTQGSNGGIGSAAHFFNPESVAVDSAGNVYVADTGNNTVRKITTDGAVGTLAGQAGSSGSTDGQGSTARFNGVRSLVVDASGTLYVTDNGNSTVRMITSGGLVSTLAGTAGKAETVNGVGTAAHFVSPLGVALNSSGTLYVTDFGVHLVRSIVVSTKVVTTLAGNPAVVGSADGLGNNASFTQPFGVALDKAGNIYVADPGTSTLRKITAGGEVTTLAGTAGTTGALNGLGSVALFKGPQGVAVDSTGNLYVADTNNHTIRKVTAGGMVSLLAGYPLTSGSADGTGLAARFNLPTSVAVDGSGNVYVADTGNNTIRMVTPAGVVTTISGLAGSGGWVDGSGSAVRWSGPKGLSMDAAGNLYVADFNNSVIRQMTSAGVVSTVAGGVGQVGAVDGTGSAARFYHPAGTAVDASGNLFVADFYNQSVRKIAPGGVVSTVGGTAGRFGNQGGQGAQAAFSYPLGVAVTAEGRLYVANSNSSSIMTASAAPVVALSSPQLLTSTGAVFNGTVNPNGAAATAVFEYGLSTAYGSTVALSFSPADDNTAHSVSVSLSGLAGGSYHYRLRASNAGGTGTTPDAVFTTYGPAAGDSSFGAAGVRITGFAGPAQASRLLQQADGRLLLVGSASNGSNYDFALARWNTDGTPDTSFGTQGTTTTDVSADDFAYAAALQSDGSILAAGSHPYNGTPPQKLTVLRYNTDGSRDLSFAFNNNLTQGLAFGLGVMSDDGFVTNCYMGSMSPYLYGFRTTSSGTQHDQLTNAGYYLPLNSLLGATASLGDTVVQPDGKVLVVHQGWDGSNYRFTVLRVNVDGSQDTTFGGSGTVMTPIGTVAGDEAPACATMQPDGKILVAGQSFNGTNLDAAVVRYNTDGSLDTSFNGTGKAVFAVGGGDDYFRGITLQADGKILLAGATYGGAYDQALLIRLNTDGSPDTSFGANGVAVFTPGSFNNRFCGVVQDSSGRIVAGGTSEDSHGVPQFTLVRLLTTVSDIKVEQPAGTFLSSGISTVDFGSVNVASGNGSVTRTFTVDSAGALPLAISGVTVDGPNAAEFVLDSTLLQSSLPPAGQTSFTVTFTPTAPGTRSAVLHITSNAQVPASFDINLSGTTNSVVTPSFASAATVPNISNGFTAGGFSLGTVNLGFEPVPGQVLTLISNISSSPVNGTFTGLPEGSTINVAYQGDTLSFVISYQGGDGNDITLKRVAAAGQAVVYSWAVAAGDTGGYGRADGTGAAARFSTPQGIVVAADGSVYVSDTGNNDIRRMSPGGVVTTFAGNADALGAVDAAGTSARFYSPKGVCADVAGNVYVADAFNHTIRKITRAGMVSTVAGRAGSFGYVNGTVSAARFNGPTAVAVDAAGNLYVTDSGNSCIRMITPGGVVSTLAGAGPAQTGSTDGTGSAARFRGPDAIVVSPGGLIYVADTGNHTIRQITPGGVVTTLAGSAGASGSADGSGSTARFYGPAGLTVDASGTLYVADTNNCTIRQVTADGVVTTLAGRLHGFTVIDGVGTAAFFAQPTAITADANGNLYVADGPVLRKITPDATVTTVAGTANQIPDITVLNNPRGVVMDAAANTYVTDSINACVRKLSPDGTMTTFAGTPGTSGSADGTGAAARFVLPAGEALDASGNLYVADMGNSTIRKITPAGVVTTLAGSPGLRGSTDGTGSAARFSFPQGVAVDGSGNVYVADTVNSTLRKITPAGVVTTFAGSAGTTGNNDGTGSAARFNRPTALVATSAGTLYVADSSNNLIRKVTSTGQVTIFAGSPLYSGNVDGTGVQANFDGPSGITMDASGTLYVADSFDETIRRVTTGAVVTTIGGAASFLGNVGGLGSAARFYVPGAIASSPPGVLMVVSNNSLLRCTPCFAPRVALSSVSSIGSASATVAGTVNPNGLLTTVKIDYGVDTTYGHSLTLPLSTANGTSGVGVQASLTGIAAGSVCYYQLSATNQDGTATAAGAFAFLPGSTADLASLTVSSGTLTPAFNSAVTAYQVVLPNATTSISVTPAFVDLSSSIAVNGVACASGSPAGPIALNVGSNTINVVVSAEDGVTQKTYVVSVLRQSHAQDWRVQNFGSPNNGGLGADDADPDHDGVSNLVEFATGTNPKVWSKPPGTVTLEGNNVAFTYTRSDVALADGFTFTVEWTTTLPTTTWSSEGVTETVLSDDGTVQTVKALVPRKGNHAVFVHLKVDAGE